MKGSWGRIKEIIQERRQKEMKGFRFWKGIKTNPRAGLVREFWRKSRGPVSLDPHPRFWTGWPREQKEAQLRGQEMCSTRQLGSNPGSTTHLASLCLGFLSCEMGIKTDPISQRVGLRIKWDLTFGTVFGAHNKWELLIPFFPWMWMQTSGKRNKGTKAHMSKLGRR